MSKQKGETYQSFLLRCWRPGGSDHATTWRFALKTVSAEPVEKRFHNLDQLLGYISAEFDTEIEEEAVSNRRNERWHT